MRELVLAENRPKDDKSSHRSSESKEIGQGHAICNDRQGNWGKVSFSWIG